MKILQTGHGIDQNQENMIREILTPNYVLMSTSDLSSCIPQNTSSKYTIHGQILITDSLQGLVFLLRISIELWYNERVHFIVLMVGCFDVGFRFKEKGN